MESGKTQKSRDIVLNNHSRPDSLPDLKDSLNSEFHGIPTVCAENTTTATTVNLNLEYSPALSRLDTIHSVMAQKDKTKSNSGSSVTRDTIASESSDSEDERENQRIENKFSVIQYNKARGSLPGRSKRKKKPSFSLEIDPNLSLSDILLPTSASAASDSNERSAEKKVRAKSGNEVTIQQKFDMFEPPPPHLLIPAVNNQFMTKLCSKMSNIQQTCFEDPFLHDVLDDMKLLQHAMAKLCRRAMLQTDDELCTE